MKRKLKWFIDNFEEVSCVIFMSIMVISLLLQVYFRYVVGKSLPWSESISRFAFLFLVCLATSLSAKKKTHIRVTAQFKLLPPEYRKVFLWLSDTIWIIFNCAVIYLGFKVYIDMGKNLYISPVLGWNLKYIFIIIPISFLLITLRMLENYYQEYIKAKNKGGNPHAS